MSVFMARNGIEQFHKHIMQDVFGWELDGVFGSDMVYRGSYYGVQCNMSVVYCQKRLEGHNQEAVDILFYRTSGTSVAKFETACELIASFPKISTGTTS